MVPSTLGLFKQNVDVLSFWVSEGDVSIHLPRRQVSRFVNGDSKTEDYFFRREAELIKSIGTIFVLMALLWGSIRRILRNELCRTTDTVVARWELHRLVVHLGYFLVDLFLLVVLLYRTTLHYGVVNQVAVSKLPLAFVFFQRLVDKDGVPVLLIRNFPAVVLRLFLFRNQRLLIALVSATHTRITDKDSHVDMHWQTVHLALRVFAALLWGCFPAVGYKDKDFYIQSILQMETYLPLRFCERLQKNLKKCVCKL